METVRELDLAHRVLGEMDFDQRVFSKTSYINELSRRLNVQPQQISRILRRLDRDRYVDRVNWTEGDILWSRELGMGPGSGAVVPELEGKLKKRYVCEICGFESSEITLDHPNGWKEMFGHAIKNHAGEMARTLARDQVTDNTPHEKLWRYWFYTRVKVRAVPPSGKSLKTPRSNYIIAYDGETELLGELDKLFPEGDEYDWSGGNPTIDWILSLSRRVKDVIKDGREWESVA